MILFVIVLLALTTGGVLAVGSDPRGHARLFKDWTSEWSLCEKISLSFLRQNINWSSNSIYSNERPPADRMTTSVVMSSGNISTVPLPMAKTLVNGLAADFYSMSETISFLIRDLYRVLPETYVGKSRRGLFNFLGRGLSYVAAWRQRQILKPLNLQSERPRSQQLKLACWLLIS